VSLFVDTSVWSLAFSRDRHAATVEVRALTDALETGQLLVSTGLVLQELLQGFSGPRASSQILGHFQAIPLLVPDRQDHVDAAELRNRCCSAGVQAGTIDVLFAQLCIRHKLTLLTTDRDFSSIAKHAQLMLWRA
jgi:predicted nucleic acid-binding protein